MPFSAVSEELAKIESAITRVQSVSFESQKLLNGQKGRKGLLCLFPQQNCSALDSVWFFLFFFLIFFFCGTGVGRFPGCLNRTGRRQQNWQLANLWTNASDGNYKISCWINRTICVPFSARSEELAKIESAIVEFRIVRIANGPKGRKGLLCRFPTKNG